MGERAFSDRLAWGVPCIVRRKDWGGAAFHALLEPLALRQALSAGGLGKGEHLRARHPRSGAAMAEADTEAHLARKKEGQG